MKDLSENEIGRWIDATPTVVQNAVTSATTEQIVQALGRQHKFHVDVTGLLYKLTVYLLVGYIKPDVASTELQSVGISEADARQVLTEINQSIFVPLREEMRRGDTNQRPQTPVQTPRSIQPRPISPPPPPAPKPQPWVRRPVVETPKPEPPLPSQQTMSPERAKKLEQMVPTPSYGIPATPPPPPPPRMPEQEPMQAPIPEWEPNTKPVDELPRGTFAPPLQSPRYPGQDRLSSYIREVTRPKPPSINRLQTTPTQPPPPPREPQRVEPPPPQITDDARLLEDREEPSPILPGTVPPQPIPRPQQAPQSEPVYRPQRPSQPPPPPPRPYASDPYREPVDEGDLQY